MLFFKVEAGCDGNFTCRRCALVKLLNHKKKETADSTASGKVCGK